MGLFISTVYVQLPEVYNILNNADTALWFLVKAYEQNPADLRLLFRIGYQYDLHLNNEGKALFYYEKFLSNSGISEAATSDSTTSMSLSFSFEDYAAARVKEIKGIGSDEKGPPGEPDDPIK